MTPPNRAAAPAVRTTKQDQLVREAIRLFSAQSYAGTSIRDLGEALGIKPGSVYAHIESKQALLVRVVEQGIDQYLAATARLVGPPAQRLGALVHAHIGVVASDIDQALVVYHQWRHIHEPDRRRIVGKRHAYERVVGHILDEGVATGEFRLAADKASSVRGILGILNWSPEWLSPDGPASLAAVGEALARIVLAGVGAGHGSGQFAVARTAPDSAAGTAETMVRFPNSQRRPS
ncbi:TetR/AcrR family transcriptional regulator [Nocardia sp. NPDC004123]